MRKCLEDPRNIKIPIQIPMQLQTNYRLFADGFKSPNPTLVISAKCQILQLFAAKNRPFYFDFANDKIFLKNLPVSTTKRPSHGRNRIDDSKIDDKLKNFTS